MVYDQNFRQEAAGNHHQSWARVKPSVYTQSFTGQAINTDNWCSRCQCLDHTTSSCPYCPRKRQWNNTGGSGNSSAVIPPLKAGRSSKFASSITSSMGTANLEKNAATFIFTVHAESPTPSPVAVREKTAVASATSEDLLACQTICFVIIYLMRCYNNNVTMAIPQLGRGSL